MSFKSAFTSFGHGVAWLAKHFVSGAQQTEAALDKVSAIAPELEQVLALASPQAANIADLAFHSLGAIAEALKSSSNAVTAGGLNVQLDTQVKQDILAAVATAEAVFKAKGITLPAPK